MKSIFSKFYLRLQAILYLPPYQVYSLLRKKLDILKYKASCWYTLRFESDRPKTTTRFSVIVACYNVGSYIDDFMTSLFSQTIDPECLEIILIDDGSKDDTAKKIEEWRLRYPSNIKYIYQENQKQSAARNKGLEIASGEWVTFIDPDDFVSLNYIACVDGEIQKIRKNELALVSCNIVFFHEATWKYDDNHPLNYKYINNRSVVSTNDQGNFMQLSCASAWFNRSLIKKHDLKFCSKIRPGFEDVHFVNRYFLLNPNCEITYLKEPIYYYRKRANKSSTLDGFTKNKAWYLDQLRYGCLDLVNFAKNLTGDVPRFLQRIIIYEIYWKLSVLIFQPNLALNVLNRENKEECILLIKTLLSFVEKEQIENFELKFFPEFMRVGMLNLAHQIMPSSTKIKIESFDKGKSLAQFSFYTLSPTHNIEIFINNGNTQSLYPSRTHLKLIDNVFCYRHFFWIHVAKGDQIKFLMNGTPTCIYYERPINYSVTYFDQTLSFEDLEGIFCVDRPSVALSYYSRLLLSISQFSWVKRKFENCWLFIDMPDASNDNAEHLYRYVTKHDQNINAFYVLEKKASSWINLRKERFNLINYGSIIHILAMLNAKYIISSHADLKTIWPNELDPLPKLRKCEFIFLQHGVIKDNISRWLNTKKFALFITSTLPEMQSITNFEAPYKFSSKEVILTGLPRHDELLSLPKSKEIILIMPTWRKYLSHHNDEGLSSDDLSKLFLKSEFFNKWNSLLLSSDINQYAKEKGLQIVFFAHQQLFPYIKLFNLPKEILLCCAKDGVSIQNLKAKTAVLITDYSSIAFEIAYLEKPCIYYQFDSQKFFGGEHTSEPGYFNYEKDGFGPVCQTSEQVNKELRNILNGSEDIKYVKRRKETFPFRDGKCCERVYEAITNLEN